MQEQSSLLRTARLREGWSQIQLADFAMVSVSSVQRAERGEPLRVDICQRLCNALNKRKPEELGLRCIGEGDESLHASTISPVSGDDPMNRRKVLQIVGGIGLSLLTTSPLSDLAYLHDEEMLSVCTTYIPICWRLYFDGHLSEVQDLLSSILSPLAVLVRQPSPYQVRAASTASKAHQLACMFALQHQDYGMALIHVDQAIQCAQIAGDDNLQVASLIRKALAYRYLKRPDEMLRSYEEATQYHKSVSPLLQGRVYTGLAEAYSNLLQENNAYRSLELAYKVFPEKPMDDPTFSYTHFKLPKGFEVVMHLNLKQPNKAWQAITQADKSISKAIIPDRVELSIDQAKAAILLGEKEQSCSFLDYAATSAKILGSTLRYNEAYSIYQQMLVKWPREQGVKALAELFRQ